MLTTFIGQQLIADLYGCDRDFLDNLDQVKAFIHRMCDAIHTEIVEESYHKFCPIGISAYAVITTSHFSIHTWPEYGYAAVDVFSCDGRLTEEIGEVMRRELGADRMMVRIVERQVAEDPRMFCRREAQATTCYSNGNYNPE